MKFTKFSIVMLFLLSLVAFALTIVLFSVRENEKAKRIQLEQVKVELETQISTLESEVKELQVQTEDLNGRLKQATDDLSQARAEAAQAKRDLAESKKSVDAQTAQVEELKKAVRVSQERNRELEDTLDKFQKNLQEMNGSDTAANSASAPVPLGAQASDTITVERADQSKVMELAAPEKTQTSDQKTDTSANKMVSESLQAGRVLLINQKFNFVIINMGSKHGLKIGDAFLVTENGEKVVKVQVEKLYDDYSAAKISEVIGNRLLLKEGNLVTRT